MLRVIRNKDEIQIWFQKNFENDNRYFMFLEEAKKYENKIACYSVISDDDKQIAIFLKSCFDGPEILLLGNDTNKIINFLKSEEVHSQPGAELMISSVTNFLNEYDYRFCARRYLSRIFYSLN